MNSFLLVVKVLYQYLIYFCTAVQHIALFLMRLYWGFLFFQGGSAKFHNLTAVAQYFHSLGITYPYFFAGLVAFFEIVGGVLLIVGFGSRLICIPLLVIMFIASFTAHRMEFMSFLTNSSAFFSAINIPFLLTSLIVFLFGPGIFSIDGIVKGILKKGEKKSGQIKKAPINPSSKDDPTRK